MSAKARTLTAKQARFVEEYLLDCNATAAAVRAGYSARNAGKIGSALLGKSRIAAAVSEAIRERSQRKGLEADSVVEELARIAFSDLRDLVEWGPDGVTVKASASISPDAAAALRSIRSQQHERGETVSVGLWDKLSALELLGRHLGMWNDRLSVDINWEALARRLEEGRMRQRRGLPGDALPSGRAEPLQNEVNERKREMTPRVSGGRGAGSSR